MAGLGFKDFANGNVLTGDELDGYLMHQSVMRFPTANARDSALAAVIADGMVAYTDDNRALWLRAGGVWRRFGPGATQPQSVDASADLIGLTNTTFDPGTAAQWLGLTFNAPHSGMVWVTVSGHSEVNTSGANAYLSFEIRNGSTIGAGGVFLAAATDNGVAIGGPGVTRLNASRRRLITGLTGGSDYNMRTLHLTTSGNYDVFHRELTIELVP